MKKVVDVVLLKVETDDEGRVTRSLIKRIPDFAFTELEGQKLKEMVLYKEHDAVTEAGGPDKVEVQISCPFCSI